MCSLLAEREAEAVVSEPVTPDHKSSADEDDKTPTAGFICDEGTVKKRKSAIKENSLDPNGSESPVLKPKLAVKSAESADETESVRTRIDGKSKPNRGRRSSAGCTEVSTKMSQPVEKMDCQSAGVERIRSPEAIVLLDQRLPQRLAGESADILFVNC